MGIKNYREKPVLRYNGHHRQRLRKIEVKAETNQTVPDT